VLVATDGPLSGRVLPRLPLVQCAWQEWVTANPATLVPDGSGESRDSRGASHLPGSPRIPNRLRESILNWDERLPHNELVLGVKIEGHSRCYPLSALAEYGRVLNDTLDGREIAIFCKPESWMAIAFLRRLDGQCLTFKTELDEIVDENTGSQWDMRFSTSPVFGCPPLVRAGIYLRAVLG
jgi:hypothetical protein